MSRQSISCGTAAIRLAVGACSLVLAFPASATITVGGDAGEISPTDPATWTNFTSAQIGISDGKRGTLAADGGSKLQTSMCYLGFGLGSTGELTVTGTGLSSTSSDLDIGYNGTGVLSVQSGGTVTCNFSDIGYKSGSSGTVTVTGAGSSWKTNNILYVGYGGSGSLTVESGGAVSNGTVYIGSTSGSSGTVMVSGTGSTWTNGPLEVGSAGTATLTVENGATVSSSFSDIGGVVRISGTGSSWTNAGTLHVGPGGQGTLTVENGGSVTTKTIWASPGDLRGNGTINAKGLLSDIDLVFDATHGLQQTLSFGTGGVLNLSIDGTGDLGAGYKGQGTMRIADGMTISSANGFIGHNAGSSGAVTVTGTGSTWTSSGAVYIGLNGGAGTLTVENGASVTATALWAASADLKGNGTINTKGFISNIDLVFDRTHGVQQTLSFGTGGILNLNVDGTADLGTGYRGQGTVRIADGVVVPSATGYVGYGAGGIGAVTITGAGSSWSLSSSTAPCIGEQGGKGSLRVENGGNFNSKNGVIGTDGGTGAVTVTGAGSSWTNNGILFLGVGAPGSTGSTLAVENGGTVSNGTTAFIGYSSGCFGSVTVTGAGSGWTSGSLNVGYSGTGSLAIEKGGTVSNGTCYVGYNSGSCGTVTVTGAGSAWTNSGYLYLGYKGSGTLTLENGGTVNNADGYIGYNSGSTGGVTVTGAGSAWTISGNLYLGYNGGGTLTVEDGGLVTATTLWGARGDLKGNGTINTKGLVADMDLVFDATHASQQAFGTGGTLNLNLDGTTSLGVGYRGQGTMRIADAKVVSATTGYIGYSSGSTGAAMVTGAGSTWTNSSSLYVGRYGSGTLTAEKGGKVSNTTGYMGYNSGSSGAVTISGAGSTWTNSSSLYIGYNGTGTLTAEKGGKVSNTTGYIGCNSGSAGAVTVTGAGSTWTSSSNLYVGYSGTGTLSVADGGTVTARSLSINSTSSVNLRIEGSGIMVLGTASSTGSVTNNGSINLYASALLAPGTYSPISDLKGRAMTWSGSGTYNAFGGTWDSTSKTFSVAAAMAAAQNSQQLLTTGERLMITANDGISQVGASFGTVADGTTFAATPMTSEQLTALDPGPGQSVLSAWNFSTNLPHGQSVLLSFNVGDTTSGLQIWHYSDNAWSVYTPTDLAYSNGIASFTVTGFSGYAVATPEPSMLGLLGLGALGLLRRARQRARQGGV